MLHLSPSYPVLHMHVRLPSQVGVFEPALLQMHAIKLQQRIKIICHFHECLPYHQLRIDNSNLPFMIKTNKSKL